MRTKTVSSRLALLAIAITAALVTQPVFGKNHQIDITENSSSSLSVTYDGSATGIDVFNFAADDWIVSFSQVLVLYGSSISWSESGNPTHNDFDQIIHGARGAPFEIRSDLFSGGAPPDGFTYVNVGVDESNAYFDVTFHDLGDSGAAPDTGTTGMLLLLGVTATFGLNFFVRREA